jgi:hypothetical protein
MQGFFRHYTKVLTIPYRCRFHWREERAVGITEPARRFSGSDWRESSVQIGNLIVAQPSAAFAAKQQKQSCGFFELFNGIDSRLERGPGNDRSMARQVQ